MPINEKDLGRYKRPSIGYHIPRCSICNRYAYNWKEYEDDYYCDEHFNIKKRKEKLEKMKYNDLIRQIDIQYRGKKLEAIEKVINNNVR